MKKYKSLVYIMFFIMVVLSSGILYLSKKDVGINRVDTLVSKVLEEKLGCLYNCEILRGNPLSGYTAENVSISLDGEKFIKAERIDLELDLFSLIRKKPVISNLETTRSRIDMDVIRTLLSDLTFPRDSSEMIIEKFSFRDTTLRTAGGSVLIDRGYIRTGGKDGALLADMDGEFNKLNLSLSAELLIDGKSLTIDNLNLSAGDTILEAEGTIGEEIDLSGAFQTPDAGIISVFFPRTEGARFSGGLRSTLAINGDTGDITVTGELEPSDFEVSRFSFDGGSGRWKFRDGILNVDEINSRVFGSPVRGKMYFNFNEKGLPMGIVLHGEELRVKDWYHPLGWLDFASGHISAMDVDLEGPYRKLSGKVSFSSEKRVTMRGHPIDGIEARASVKDGSEVSFDGQGSWYGAPVTGEGSISFGRGGASSMSFRTENLNISNLAGDYPQVGRLGLQGNLKGEIHVQGENAEPSIRGFFRTDRFRAGEDLFENASFSFVHRNDMTELESLEALWRGTAFKASGEGHDLLSSSPGGDLRITSPQVNDLLPLPLKDLSISGSFSGDRFHVKKLNGKTAGGDLSVEGVLTFSNGGDITMDMKGNFDNINAPVIAAALGIDLALEGSLSGTAAVTGKTSNPDISLNLYSEKLKTSPLPVKDLKVALKIRDDTIFLKGFKALLADSPLKVSGQIDLRDRKNPSMDLRGTITALNLEKAFQQSAGLPPLAGEASADIRMTGDLHEPAFSMVSTSPEVQVEGFTFKDVSLETINSTEEQGLVSYLLGLRAGSTPLEVTGDIIETEQGPKITFDSRGEDLELADLIEKMDPQVPGVLKGKVDYSLKGEISDATLAGDATISSNEITYKGLKLRNVKLPVTYENSSLRSDEASAFLYGGKVLLSGQMDLKGGKWQSWTTVTGTDMELLTSDLIEGGVVTGEGDLDIELSGMIGKVYLLNGNGSLRLREGSLKGFERLNKITREGEIRFRSVDAIYNVDGRDIYLMPGSKISAPPKDSSYKYLSASGVLGGKKEPMKLKLQGELNVQALGGVMNAMEGIVKDEADSQIILQNFFSGLVGGYTGSDFRKVHLDLKGTWSDPVISDLEILKPGTIQPIPSAGERDSKPDNIKFEVKFPTGEGVDASESTEEQVKKQFMDNILNQIFPEGEDSGKGTP